jgi:hypothetical protein
MHPVQADRADPDNAWVSDGGYLTVLWFSGTIDHPLFTLLGALEIILRDDFFSCRLIGEFSTVENQKRESMANRISPIREVG